MSLAGYLFVVRLDDDTLNMTRGQPTGGGARTDDNPHQILWRGTWYVLGEIKMTNKSIVLALTIGIASIASAQVDPGAFWPGYKNGNDRAASAAVAGGPAIIFDQTWTTDQPASMGGLTIGSDGNLYFKTRTGDNSKPRVYKIDPSDGTILAMSPELDGDAGSYAGLTHGTNFLWTSVSSTAGGTRVSKIIKLNYADLTIAEEITNAAFDTPGDSLGLRGEPVLGSVTNQNGNVNIYVHERGNPTGSTPSGLIHCLDSVTGELQWTYDPMTTGTSAFFGRLGPVWVADDGNGDRNYIAYFGNKSGAGAGICIRDNADGTFTEVWLGGPDNANWFGTGAMNAAQDTIYVSTFNDGDTASLWSIDAMTGAQNWSVPGLAGTINELNFFGRPAVMGDRVYVGGAFGVITCFEDDGAGGFTQPWEVRPAAVDDGSDQFVADPDTRAAWQTDQDFFRSGDITALTVVEVEMSGTPTRYIYAVMEQQPQETGMGDPETAQLIILRDDGASATEILRTSLEDSMNPTRWGSASPTVDANGLLFIVGGNPTITGSDQGEIYKFKSLCGPADRNNDGIVDFFDVQHFLNSYAAQEQSADIIDDDQWDFFDVQAYLNIFAAGCDGGGKGGKP